MLSARITPSLAKYAQLRYASYQPVLGTLKLTTCSVGKESNRVTATGVDSGQLILPSNFITTRSYASNQPSLSSKNELEKVFFKVTVVIWDLAWKLTLWAWAMLKKHVILNATVQSYWKTFNQKLEEARRN